jgi:superoxide dismutase, Cu-Zn family
MWGYNDSDQNHPGHARVGSVSVRRPIRQRFAVVAVTAAAALASTACAYKGLNMPQESASILQGEGTLTAPAAGAKAITYNPQLAPPGAQLSATLTPSGESTIVEFTVARMVPNRSSAVHAHTSACNVNPESAGPHYQNEVDPAATPQQPSTNPEYANPQNEIWLDLRTDASGSGTARTTVPFVFTGRGPASIVVHQEERTKMGQGEAGEAGGRVACLTLSAAGFKPLS